MKITIDLPSLALGGIAAAALAMTMSAAQVRHTSTGPQMSGPNDVVSGNQNRPFARDLVFLRGIDPIYTVPAGKILVLVGLGETSQVVNSFYRELALVVDGQAMEFQFQGNVVGTWNLTSGIPIPEASTVELRYINPPGGTGFNRAAYVTGYLEDA